MTTKEELLDRAKALGMKPVTRNSVAELEAMITEAEAAAKPTKVSKPRKTRQLDPNVEVERLMAVIRDGTFARVLEREGLTAGGLARQLEVEPAVIAKIVSGKRRPRPNAARADPPRAQDPLHAGAGSGLAASARHQ